jgi:hypothetical protein
VLRLERLLDHLRLFEFHLPPVNGVMSEVIIGQCAVLQRRDAILFADRIHLIPEYDEYWSECLAALMEKIGPNTYHYGSLWNHERPRSFELDCVSPAGDAGGDIFHLDVVATRRWPDFATYLQSVSANVRRDYRKALLAGNLRIVCRRGWRAIALILPIIECRAAVKHKNGAKYRQSSSTAIEVLKLAVKITLFDRRSLVAIVQRGKRPLAAFVGFEFGDRLYFLTGGTKPNRDGAGAWLMMNIMKELFEQQGNRELVLGYCRGRASPENYDQGLLLYRRKLRAEAVNGVRDTLVYRPEPAMKTDPTARSTTHRWLRRAIGVAVAMVGSVAPAVEIAGQQADRRSGVLQKSGTAPKVGGIPKRRQG